MVFGSSGAEAIGSETQNLIWFWDPPTKWLMETRFDHFESKHMSCTNIFFLNY